MAIAITKKVEEGEDEADPDAVNMYMQVHLRTCICLYASIDKCVLFL